MLSVRRTNSMGIINPTTLRWVIPLACAWAEKQEAVIMRDGVALTANQILDAKRIGVTAPERVRLRVVDQIPSPLHPILRWAGRKIGLVSDSTTGLTLRYGIFIRSDY